MEPIFCIVASAMVFIVVLMRFKLPVGLSILLGGLYIWAFRGADISALWNALLSTLTQTRTWELIFCLYFVMGLEVELRKSDSLKGVVHSLRCIFRSNKVTLAVMPAFLGLLPSVGGARFSCPIVSEASKGIGISHVDQSAINLWFRHICEFANPLVPGLILACSIANVSIGQLITHLGWLTPLCFVLGWIVLIRPLRNTDPSEAVDTSEDRRIDWKSLFLALGPIIFVFILVVGFKISSSIATGIAVFGFLPLFTLLHRPVSLKDVLIESLDRKLFTNVFLILYFIEILTATDSLDAITQGLLKLDLSQPILFACLALIFGAITGLTQAYIAMVIPLVAAVSPGDVTLIGIVIAFGFAGQMVTPTHMCILITVDYFKSELWQTIKKEALLSALTMLIYSAWIYLRYYS
jgi:hypothetical protein